MTVEQKMARSVEMWRKCDPILMATQSQAALIFAFRDMKRDILVLADEVERLQARVAELESQAQAVEDSEICAGAELMMVHDRFMRGVLTKEIMVDAVNRVGKKSISRIKAEAIRAAAEEYEREYCGQGVVALLLDYANQIEGGE